MSWTDGLVLRKLAALGENPGLVPSTTEWGSQPSLTLLSKGTRHAHGIETYV